MKKILLPCLFFVASFDTYCQTMQSTIKPGSTPRTIDVYLKPSASFSQKDEAMTFALAMPATVLPAPTMGSSGVTPNSTGVVSGISGVQPNFLINNLGSTSREVVVSTQNINSVSYYIYTFIFAGTAAANHAWTTEIEQKVFSIQFNGCTSNCEPSNELLVNLTNGGTQGNSYWYFQPNTLGDITNYAAPFYSTPQSTTANNGGSSDGSGLSTIGLATPVSLPVKLSSFNINTNSCNSNLLWQVAEEINAAWYVVERSSDGFNFKEIGRVKPSSSTSTIKSYSFLDDNTVIGSSYYRLNIIDRDRKQSYSSVIEANSNCSSKRKLRAYPTFTTGLVNIQLPLGSENATISLINYIGQELAIDAMKTTSRVFNISKYPNGTYILVLRKNQKVIDNIKVVLQH